MAEIQIRNLTAVDWDAIRRIYLEGMATGQATFETVAPSWQKWDENHLPFARLGAAVSRNTLIVGWAALSPVSKRAVYSGVAEVSVYVAVNARGQGVGRALLTSLIVESERNGIWTLRAGIFPENLPSISLHKSLDFTVTGRHKRIAKLNGVWRDTVLLERRSKTVGND